MASRGSWWSQQRARQSSWWTGHWGWLFPVLMAVAVGTGTALVRSAGYGLLAGMAVLVVTLLFVWVEKGREAQRRAVERDPTTRARPLRLARRGGGVTGVIAAAGTLINGGSLLETLIGGLVGYVLGVGLYYRRYTKEQREEGAPKQRKLVLGGPYETARDRDE